MTTLRFKQVDVFTDKPFLGNPVAVVIGAEGLDTEAMQRIACWTNLSETTFLLKSDAADYRLRIFTPRMELPFAGHPTIGSAHAALESGFISSKSKITQECGAGIFDLTVEEGRIFVKGPAAKIDPAKEIPVCGSGNIGVAAYLKSRNELNRFGQRYEARQGMQVGRDGRIFMRIDTDGIRLGGHAVTCVDGGIVGG
jgi:predicted PhzF superfamily epimerase YddE/YHI9